MHRNIHSFSLHTSCHHNTHDLITAHWFSSQHTISTHTISSQHTGSHHNTRSQHNTHDLITTHTISTQHTGSHHNTRSHHNTHDLFTTHWFLSQHTRSHHNTHVLIREALSISGSERLDFSNFFRLLFSSLDVSLPQNENPMLTNFGPAAKYHQVRITKNSNIN